MIIFFTAACILDKGHIIYASLHACHIQSRCILHHESKFSSVSHEEISTMHKPYKQTFVLQKRFRKKNQQGRIETGDNTANYMSM